MSRMEKALTPFPFKFAFYRGPGERAKSAGKPAGINKGSRGQGVLVFNLTQSHILLDKQNVFVENCSIKPFCEIKI